MPDTPTTPPPLPAGQFKICAFSGDEFPVSQMTQYGDDWVANVHKDAFVQKLRENPGADRSPKPLVAWVIIIASTVFMALSANYPTSGAKTAETEESRQNQLKAKAAGEMTMMKIQSRFLVGFKDSPGISQGADQLESFATTPNSIAALATLYAILDPDDGLEKANELLDGIADESAAELVEQTRSALNDGVDEETRATLEKSLGWFSKLLPSSDPNSTVVNDVVAKSQMAAVIVFAVIAIFGLAFLAGIVILIMGLFFKQSGKLKFHYTSDQNPTHTHKHLFLEAFAVYLFLMALGHVLGQILHPYFGLAGYASSFLLALFWPRIRGLSWKETREMIGWKRGKGFFKEVGCGLVGYMGILVFLFCGVIIMLFFTFIAAVMAESKGASGGGPPQGSHPIVGMLDQAQSVWGVLKLFILAAVLAPLLEETMFRGAFHRYVRYRWGFWLSAIVGGIIFAVVHPQGWVAVPALTAMGMGFTLLREWRNSLVASMTAHAVHNGTIVCVVLLMVS